MAKNALVEKRFDGGWSPDPQLGPKHSFAYSRAIDFRKKPSQLSVLPGPAREGAETITDLIQNTVMINSGEVFGLGDAGNFYRRTTAGQWVLVGNLGSGAYGLSYRSDVDKLFMTSTTTVSEYSPLTASPQLRKHKYTVSASTDTNGYLDAGTNTYTLKTAITEDAVDKQEFSLDIEPLRTIRVQVADGGTGDWTLTLHDATNNTLATETVTNANITDGQFLDFTFDDAVRLYVKPNARTYHFHLTSTVADGTVYCSTASDLNTCGFTAYADRLIETRNGMHPIQTFLQYECIGNGNYLSVWEPLSDGPSNLEWLRHRLVFPAGLEVCGLARYQEFLAIACEKRTDSGDPQEGAIYFWDGLSSTYNHWLPVPEGSPYSLHEHKDVLYYVAGGDLYAYAGGTPVKIRTLPETDSEYSDATDTTITYPYMATVRRGVHLIGFPSHTTNTAIEHGVYSYGANNKDFDDSFGYNYAISTGTLTNTGGSLRLGHVKNYGDTLFTSWRDNSNGYGLDKLDNSSDPASTAVWESLWFDNNMPFKQKTGNYLIATFEPLPANVELVLKYRTERNGAWTESSAFTNANTPENTAKFPITNKRFLEVQRGFEFTTTGTETPVVTSLTLVFDDNNKEQLA